MPAALCDVTDSAAIKNVSVRCINFVQTFISLPIMPQGNIYIAQTRLIYVCIYIYIHIYIYIMNKYILIYSILPFIYFAIPYLLMYV